MSAGIVVKEFEYIPGKNDAEYIKLLKKQLERYKAINKKAIQKIRYISSAYALVKHGHWITDEDWDSCCSVCGDQLSGELNPFKYCPFCGALMDEVTE